MTYTDDDPRGGSPKSREKVPWQISRYYADGYSHPLAELILVDGAGHVPHSCNARFAWNFFCRFRRAEDGTLQEIE